MWKRIVMGSLFVSFMAVSSWATYQVGYFGIFAVALAGPGEAQVFMDLCVACTFGCAWLLGDARKRDTNPWPWVAMVPFLGSIPIISYWVARELKLIGTARPEPLVAA